MTSYVNQSPNFSIIVPGWCNARCEFCSWREQKAWTGTSYEFILDKALDELPERFRTVSITGGEPTISKRFGSVISAINNHRTRFDRVVLTTNGAALSKVATELEGVVDFVNISRHKVSDAKNRAVFKTDSVPGADQLSSQIHLLNQFGIQVTLSKVLGGAELKHNLTSYIGFAKRIGASGVFFRKQNGDLSPHPAESLFSDHRAVVSSCPACLNSRQVINGMTVTWKRGLLETDTVGAHEIVMQQTGVLSTDWAGKNVVTMPAIRRLFRDDGDSSAGKTPPERLAVYRQVPVGCELSHSVSGGGCGGPTYSSSGGCGTRGSQYGC